MQANCAEFEEALGLVGCADGALFQSNSMNDQLVELGGLLGNGLLGGHGGLGLDGEGTHVEVGGMTGDSRSAEAGCIAGTAVVAGVVGVGW